MRLTALQRVRLDVAVRALQEAGAEKLHGRLRAAFYGEGGEVVAVLAQARAWASVGWSDPYTREVRVAARDAVGLLWAAMEDQEDT